MTPSRNAGDTVGGRFPLQARRLRVAATEAEAQARCELEPSAGTVAGPSRARLAAAETLRAARARRSSRTLPVYAKQAGARET